MANFILSIFSLHFVFQAAHISFSSANQELYIYQQQQLIAEFQELFRRKNSKDAKTEMLDGFLENLLINEQLKLILCVVSMTVNCFVCVAVAVAVGVLSACQI